MHTYVYIFYIYIFQIFNKLSKFRISISVSVCNLGWMFLLILSQSILGFSMQDTCNEGLQ